MTLTPSKKCPKCSSEMLQDRSIGTYTEITLKKEGEFLGERIRVFYCLSCGFIELYRNGEQEQSKG
jgi:predicted nucleic-acid-binding Zn-ribbon protein